MGLDFITALQTILIVPLNELRLVGDFLRGTGSGKRGCDSTHCKLKLFWLCQILGFESIKFYKRPRERLNGRWSCITCVTRWEA